MVIEKISPELQLAIGTSPEMREKSLDLDVGYRPLLRQWELIIRYTGDLSEILNTLDVFIEELLGGYGIIRIYENQIGLLSEFPQIDYIEKPKNMFIEEMEGIAASCINRLRLPDFNLTGKGVLVACLDSGVDIFHPDFQNEDGTTRIVSLWDQTIPGNPPDGFFIGSVYDEEDINEALALGKIEGSRIVPQFDASGHGTAVLGILAGNGRASGERNVGVAPDADILVVKLGNVEEGGFPRTTQLMRALDYVVRYGIAARKPLAINVSYGNNYGSHTGDSVLEQYMDTIAGFYRVSIVTGTGNEGITARHTGGVLNREETEEIYVSPYLTSFNLQIWKYYQDDIQITLEDPSGRKVVPFSPFSKVQTYELPNETVSVYYGVPTPYNPEQEIYISWIPRGSYITSGVWKLHLEPIRIVSGQYKMWLPVAGSTSAEVRFVRPVLLDTLTIPSTARYVLSVAAYDSRNNVYASFSGRGPKTEGVFTTNRYKPDIAAPGVDINTCSIGGGYRGVSGTSFAAPFVTGAAALLMQYGIVEGRDPYLYGEKLRANIIRGARKLPFQEQQPSPQVGWGALCVADSIPEYL